MSDWRTAALAALAVAVVGLGAWDYNLSQQLRGGQSHTYQFHGSEGMEGAQGIVADFPRAGFAFVDLYQLPELGGARVYELWLVGFNGAPQPAGVFQPDAAGQATVVVARSLESVTEVDVTVEPAPGGSRLPTQPSRLVAKL